MLIITSAVHPVCINTPTGGSTKHAIASIMNLSVSATAIWFSVLVFLWFGVGLVSECVCGDG